MHDDRLAKSTELAETLRSCRVYTSATIAEAMVASVNPATADTWLDPCVGEGAFVKAMLRARVPARKIEGIDLLDSNFVPSEGVTLHTGVDFIEWAATCDKRYSRIVANPPYLSIHRLPSHLRERALAVPVVRSTCVPRTSNYWLAFLAQSLKLLEPGGNLCFVLPASWEYADYAADIREFLPTRFASFDVHRSLTPLFPQVQEGSVVIVGRGYQQQQRTSRYFEHNSAAELSRGLVQLNGAPKTRATALRSTQLKSESHLVPLGSVLDVRIGAVTGDASYFLLTETRRRELALPAASVRPILTHARHLTAAVITKADWKRLRASGERVWLFRPRAGLMKHKAIRSYLRLDLDEGGCNRNAHKVSRREPWHRVPLPSWPDGFMSGMSRTGPWIALNSMRDLTASNTLYCVHFSKAASDAEKAAWSLSLLTTTARNQLAPLGRRYPDGLLKFEPGDLAEVLVPRPPSFAGARRVYRRAVGRLLAGAVTEAQALADTWLEDGRLNAAEALGVNGSLWSSPLRKHRSAETTETLGR